MSHIYYDSGETGICFCISRVGLVAHLPWKAQHGAVVSVTPTVVLQPNVVTATTSCRGLLLSFPAFSPTVHEDSWVRTSCFFTCLLLDYILPSSELCSCCYMVAFGGPAGMGEEEGERTLSSRGAGSGSVCPQNRAVSPSLSMLRW